MVELMVPTRHCKREDWSCVPGRCACTCLWCHGKWSEGTVRAWADKLKASGTAPEGLDDLVWSYIGLLREGQVDLRERDERRRLREAAISIATERRRCVGVIEKLGHEHSDLHEVAPHFAKAVGKKPYRREWCTRCGETGEIMVHCEEKTSPYHGERLLVSYCGQCLTPLCDHCLKEGCCGNVPAIDGAREEMQD